MIKIDSNFSVRLSDNSLHKAKGRKKVKVIQFNTLKQLITFTAKQMLIQSLEGETIGVDEYTRVFEDNVATIKLQIQKDAKLVK